MRLSELLKSEGLNQTEFAEKINVSQKTISNYLKETTEPTMSVLIKIANHYNVSLDYLCGREWNNQIGYIPEERKAIIQQLIDLNESDFKEVSTFIRGYLAGKNKTSFQIFEN